MGLTVKKMQRLLKKRFNALYDEHKAEWEEVLSNAVEFLDNTLPEGERILSDDLQHVISDLVAVHPTFSRYVEEKGLTQQYWAVDFSDYIVYQKYGREIVKRGEGKKA